MIWVPAFREFESHKPPVWANRRMHGLLGTAKIDQFNRELYRIIRPKLLADDPTASGPTPAGENDAVRAGTMGFFDQIQVSASREDLSVDGVHMTGEWYSEMTSYIMQMFCGDVMASLATDDRKF